MNLTLHKSTFFSNLRFWSFHSTINAIPSFCIAYIHDWNTIESLIAMTIGIILFAIMWSFLVSLKDIDKFCNSSFISSSIKAGVYLRLAIIILSAPFLIGFIIYLFTEAEAFNNLAKVVGLIWVGDFFIGIASHEFYSNFREIIPIRGVHSFLPTVIITLVQGFLLMGTMLIAGMVISSIDLITGTYRIEKRIAQN